jgi:radical SAM protein with 4Fe4S-binding SPASM domain
MQITQSPTFCSAPWTSLNIDQTGRVTPCLHCYDSVGNIKDTPIQEVITGPILTSMREHMARGEWHPGCNWCKRLEETTGASGRTVRLASKETLTAIDNNPTRYFELQHIVVNWSNLCNLTCVYCNPETSTAWQSVKSIPINHVKNEHPDLIELARSQGNTVIGLSLGGGEPLLQKGLLDFLKCLNSKQVQVLVTTNLSIDITSNPIYNELRTWPKVNWQISFDNANPAKFEYVRDGANWETFVANIRLMKQHNQRVIAHPAYSIYCAVDLVEYYDFCVAEELDLFWCELIHPWDLDIRRYPKAIRQQAIDEIDCVVEKFGHKFNLDIEALKRYRMTLVDNSYLPQQQYRLETLKFHRIKEKELRKINTFEQLWTTLAQQL